MTSIRAAAAELPHVGLADALAICLVMSCTEGEPYERAAARWLARLISEHPEVELRDVRAALDALVALPHAPAQARHQLVEVCERHGLGPVAGLHR